MIPLVVEELKAHTLFVCLFVCFYAQSIRTISGLCLAWKNAKGGGTD